MCTSKLAIRKLSQGPFQTQITEPHVAFMTHSGTMVGLTASNGRSYVWQRGRHGGWIDTRTGVNRTEFVQRELLCKGGGKNKANGKGKDKNHSKGYSGKNKHNADGKGKAKNKGSKGCNGKGGKEKNKDDGKGCKGKSDDKNKDDAAFRQEQGRLSPDDQDSEQEGICRAAIRALAQMPCPQTLPSTLLSTGSDPTTSSLNSYEFVKNEHVHDDPAYQNQIHDV